MPKLKIGLVLDTSLDPSDGVQQYVIQLGQWLTSQGNNVHYLVGETTTRDLPNLHSLAKNISVNFNGNRTTIPLFASRKKLKQFIEQQQFDVLHIQTPHHPFMAQRLILAASDRTAVIGTFHVLPYGKLAEIGNFILGVWLRPSLRRFDKMLAVSSVAADFCLNSFHTKSTVIPNMIDYGRFNHAQGLEAFNDDVLTILFLGRLVERKGCLTLLKSIVKLKQYSDIPKYRVVICGKGPLESELKSFVKNNDLENTVIFTGYVSESDKPRYYASADMAVFPSSSGESFGIVLLEAMASGCAAVLAGDNPGYRSVMQPQADLLFDANNADNLSEIIAHYLRDGNLRQKMAKWGHSYAAEFDVNIIGPKVLNVYKEALLKRRKQ